MQPMTPPIDAEPRPFAVKRLLDNLPESPLGFALELVFDGDLSKASSVEFIDAKTGHRFSIPAKLWKGLNTIVMDNGGF